VLLALAGCAGSPAPQGGAPDPGAVLGPMPTTGAGPAEHEHAAFRSGGMLMVRKGGTIVDLGVNETGDAIQLPRLVTVARLVLARL